MPRPRESLRAPLVLVALLASGRAAAQNVTLRLEPGYSAASTTVKDNETGARSTSETQAFDQRYRLTLNRNLTETVLFAAGGLFNWQQGWTTIPAGTAERDAKLWNMDAALVLNGPVLTGGLRYDRREEDLESRTFGQLSSEPGRVRESFTGSATWRPEEAPRIDLHVGHVLTYDRTRTVADETLDQASLNARYTPTQGLELRYGADYSRPEDHVKRVVTTRFGQSGRAAYSRPFLAERGNFHVAYTLMHQTSETTALGAGGVVTSQVFPTQGLSIVEPLPTPEQVTLVSNPALVDGGFETAAGLDLGYGRTLAGDNRLRDMGAELADPEAQVNRIDVYVDKPLPPEVAATLTWSAYRSDDNRTWTPVSLGGGVRFEPFLNRFEIPIATTQSRYVKVVTRPLLPASTTDTRFESVFVTEIQLLLATTAEEAESRGRISSLSGIFGGSATFKILRGPDLTYDHSLSLSHADQPSFRYSWSTVNGLTFAHRLTSALAVRSRLDRSDTEGPNGHSAVNRLSATLVADPIPTVTAAATATGEISETAQGTGNRNTLSLLTRLDPYRGVSLGLNGTASFGTSEVGQTTRSRIAGATLSLLPHPKATVGVSYVYSQSRASGGGVPERENELQSLEGNVSVQPFRALYASAGATRTLAGGPAATLASFVLGFSPFPDGALMLRATYTDTIDTGLDQRTRTAGPSLRWNIRRGTYLDVSYLFQDIRSPVADTVTRTFFTNLVVTPIG